MQRPLVLLLLLVAQSAAAQITSDTLRAPEVPLRTFGWSVAATDEWLLVGANEYGRFTKGVSPERLADPTGTVFVYRLGEGLPVLAGRLESDRIGIDDCFSWTLAVRGDLAAVGASCEYVGGRQGSVYLYRSDGSTWVREAKLRASDLAGTAPRGNSFGGSVALGDGYLVVTGAGPINPSTNSWGAEVFIFEQVGGLWTHTATLDADATDTEGFGASIATADGPWGDAIVVGAVFGGVAGGNVSGAVYPFERVGGQWVQRARILNPRTSPGDRFGTIVSWGDGGGLVSARSAVYPLDRVGGVWTLGASLTPPDALTIAAARFGRTAVAVGTSRTRPSTPGLDLYRATLGADSARVSVSTVDDTYGITDYGVSLNRRHLFYGRARLDLPSDYVLIQPLTLTTDGDPSPAAVAGRLTLAPNPTAGATRVLFETAAPGPARLVVVDALGRRVAEQALGDLVAGPHTVALEAGTLPAGVYLVRVETADGRRVQRLVRR